MPGIRHSDYGAEELKREYNRDLGNGLAISVALHLFLIFLFTVTRDPNAKPEVDTRLRELSLDTTTSVPISLEAFGDDRYKPGGGGGSLERKAPEAKSTKGLPEAEPVKAEPKEPRKVKEDLIAVKNPPKIRVVEREPKEPSAGVAPKKDSAAKAPAVIGPKGDHQLGSGDVTKPGGGTGGPGVGYGSGGGVGFSLGGYGNRGWLVRPTAKYPDGTQATGEVQLRFTAQPNGDITNIIPVKQASPALVQAAIAGLKRAKARPVAEGGPQSYVITYNFDVR